MTQPWDGQQPQRSYSPAPVDNSLPSAPGPSRYPTYSGFGVFAGEHKKKRRRRTLLTVGVVIGVVAVGLLGAWQLGAFRGDVLDSQSVEQGVVTVMKNNFGEADVRDARCPSNQSIQTGHTFECSVVVGGQQKTVGIRVLNDKPEFEIGAPR